MSALAGIDIALWDLKGMIEHLLLSGGGLPLSPPIPPQPLHVSLLPIPSPTSCPGAQPVRSSGRHVLRPLANDVQSIRRVAHFRLAAGVPTAVPHPLHSLPAATYSRLAQDED